jgi:hypothetical protein
MRQFPIPQMNVCVTISLTRSVLQISQQIIKNWSGTITDFCSSPVTFFKLHLSQYKSKDTLKRDLVKVLGIKCYKIIKLEENAGKAEAATNVGMVILNS